MPVISYTAAIRAAIAAGWPAGTAQDREQLAVLLAVGKAESGLNSTAVNRNRNGSIDVGVWQINSVHGYDPDDMRDPTKNAAAARAIHARQGWAAWYAYRDGKHRAFLSDARAAVKAGTVFAAPQPVGIGGTGRVIRDAGGAIISDPSRAGEIAGGIIAPGADLDPLAALGKIAAALGDPAWWRRIGVGALGVVLIIAGVAYLGRDLITDTAASIIGAKT